MANINNHKEEPSTAPQPNRWYDMTLGSSFKDHSSTKFCTLRYEFKPASIDKNQRGSLHKNKENRVTVEFPNNQPGKPKVSFEGSSEDYKDNDAVLFFDGETFRLERLHRAVKRLRHVRLPGESAAAVATTGAATAAGPTVESRSPPLGKTSKSQLANKTFIPSVPVEVEKIDVGEIESPAANRTTKGVVDYPSAPNQSTVPTETRNYELEEHLNLLFNDDDDDGVQTPNKATTGEEEGNNGFDIPISNHIDSDDEIADADASDGEAVKQPNPVEALSGQVNAEGRNGQTSSSSGSSGSGSSGSGSGSGSSSSDSEASDDDSVSSI